MEKIWAVTTGLTGENTVWGVFSDKDKCDAFYEKLKPINQEAYKRQFNFNPDPSLLDGKQSWNVWDAIEPEG